ncbi:CYTH-like domain-containing protein [Lasiosphaeria miniovina]|uniref:mRNA-capping enzyme subunit beta n=1 Tax=Lasiosphaeria miniovina TaxID=1954250 RepID=A0AA40DV12_9PEZI|nr:CYTH-like domain-containing protein [Lasiosphaeria miniovina]KAK0712833.1 CYTH-like domain-containing protein [Lasiosphaeria miniovina]
MDLRGMLNDNGPAGAAPSKPPQPPPLLPQQQQQQQQLQPPPLQPQPALPSTPVQTISQQSFRDYSQTQPSPSRQFSQDYSAQHVVPGAAFTSPPPPYPGVAGPYPSRPPPPPPPPLQQILPNDLRSPIMTSGPVASPYRQTPTSSISAASGSGYPFPPQQQTPTSPVQRHQYPPPTSAYHRESYPQPSGHGGMTGPPVAASYMQGQQMPQTPPVGTPAGPQPYLQRSQSAHSTPTSTSAQGQPVQYGAPFAQGSPGAPAHPLPQMDPQQRQSSQPPTPIAGPLSGPRPSQTLGYGQPSSPYQQRLPSAPTYHVPPSQSSPPPPPPPALPRHPSSQSLYDPHSQDSLRRSQSHSERDRSLSVSPKTQIPSLPSSSGRPSTSLPDSESRYHPIQPAPAMPSAVEPDRDRERGVTPGKRKLDDRELRPDELEKRDVRPPPFEGVNGRHGDAAPPAPFHAMPKKGEKNLKVYQTPPIWAQTAQKGRILANPNRVIYRPVVHSHSTQVNGKPDSRLPSRHTSPEDKRAIPPTQVAPSAPPPAQPPAQALPEPAPALGPLGEWEASITNAIPQEAMTKVIADFLFKHVVLNEDMNEIQSRGVQFEIEAKLGTLIDRSTSQRVNLPVLSDCVLNDSGNWLNFRSSMTERQHKLFNEFLNQMVVLTHPDNKEVNAGRSRRRVPIMYKHRREVDKFFELPSQVRDQMLPACVANLVAARQHAAKVRITYDQKTNEVLAKIIKARVADISIHFPDSPLDCRISINLEMDWDGPIDKLENDGRAPIPHRNKDRLSYTHSHYQVDLTQVTQMVPGANNTQRQDKEHELEIEVAPQVLINQGRAAMDNQPHQYVELVEGLLNNIRVLTRKAKDFGMSG